MASQITNKTFDTQDVNVLIEHLNERERAKYTGVIVFLVLLMVLGIIGNILVLIVYKLKFKRSSARIYILSLALADLSVCVVGIPYHVLDLRLTLTYTYTELCRGLSFLIGACTLSSIFILLVVGFDRYLKVCRPLKKQIKDFGDRKACIIATIIACVLNIPNGVIYGQSTVLTEVTNVTGVECFIADEFMESVFGTGFLGFNLLLFVISVSFLIIIYSLICRVIYKQDRLQGDIILKQSRTVCFCCKIADNEMNEDEEDDAIDDVIDDAEHGTVRDESNGETVKLQSVSDSKGSTGDSKDATPDEQKPLTKQKVKNSTKKTQKTDRKSRSTVRKVPSSAMIRHTAASAPPKEKNTRKITLMMLTITVVFIVTYLPFIVISILDSMDDEFWSTLSDYEAIFYDALLRLYIVNNVVNPFIYGFWDNRFRKEVVALLRKLLCCLKEGKCAGGTASTAGSSSSNTSNNTQHDTKTNISILK